MRLPVLDLDTVYHIGTLDPSQCGHRWSTSQEYHCLSVSVCPEGWQQIARLGGLPLYKLQLSGGLFVDMQAALSNRDLVAEVEHWAHRQGLATKETRWFACRQDDELGTVLRIPCHSPMEALAEAGLESVQDSKDEAWIEGRSQWVASDALVVRYGLPANRGDDLEVLLVAWIEDIARPLLGRPLDGLWWQDDYKPHALVAPKGGIFPDRLKAWQAAEVSWHAAPSDEELLDAASLSSREIRLKGITPAALIQGRFVMQQYTHTISGRLPLGDKGEEAIVALKRSLKDLDIGHHELEILYLMAEGRTDGGPLWSFQLSADLVGEDEEKAVIAVVEQLASAIRYPTALATKGFAYGSTLGLANSEEEAREAEAGHLLILKKAKPLLQDAHRLLHPSEGDQKSPVDYQALVKRIAEMDTKQTSAPSRSGRPRLR